MSHTRKKAPLHRWVRPQSEVLMWKKSCFHADQGVGNYVTMKKRILKKYELNKTKFQKSIFKKD